MRTAQARFCGSRGGQPPRLPDDAGRAGAEQVSEVDRLPGEVRELLSDEVVDELLAGARSEEEIVGPGGLLSQLTKRLVERAMDVELTDHLGYEHGQSPPGGAVNTRNGSSPKTLVTEHGSVRIDAPRDRQGTFEPRVVRKRQRHFEGFDEKIIRSMPVACRCAISRRT